MLTGFKYRTCESCRVRQDASQYQSLYAHYCQTCLEKRVQLRANKRFRKHRAHKLHKDKQCAKCGFVPRYSCQLDVDHINGHHQDDRPSNLQTLCANCHRAKTFEEHNVHKGNGHKINSPKYRPFKINPLYKRVPITMKSLNNQANIRAGLNAKPVENSSLDSRV